MCDEHLGAINTARHSIELADPTTPPAHSAPYCVGPKAREFDYTKQLQYTILSLFTYPNSEQRLPVADQN